MASKILERMVNVSDVKINTNLFRARWVDKPNIWVYGFYVHNPLLDRSEIISFDKERSYVYRVMPETVGVFTGFYDNTKWQDLFEYEQEEWFKNHSSSEEWRGRPISTNDIVDFKTFSYEFKRMYVGWDQNHGMFVVINWEKTESYPMDNRFEYDIISDTHSNPQYFSKGFLAYSFKRCENCEHLSELNGCCIKRGIRPCGTDICRLFIPK